MASRAFPTDPTDPSGPTGPTVVVELIGDLDRPARERLEALLVALAPVPQAIVVDVSEAWCDSSLALARLCRFRAARHARGLACRLRGLHPDVAPDWEQVPLEQLFAVYADSRRPAAG
ncbi:STAS domain-containing protein [Actinomycetospora chiangmaiensis]|uniref:STAS domain-containing protein n=1 Tax=Actinomycetospora chiangmaiensis TaxID=402650 RepID=UPI000361DA25|nr:STAS domain-containing protein [Actinomycetospora chiangmaiensis]